MLPALRWVHLMRDGKTTAELLMSADISYEPAVVDTPTPPLPPAAIAGPIAGEPAEPQRIPPEICPVMARFK